MKILKDSRRPAPALSFILLDWSVRESFHLLHYLRRQDVARDSFEVIVIEYYDRVSPAVQAFEDEVDTWVLLQLPAGACYHKHLMYNAGIVFSTGEICVICDSDAMVKPGFARAIRREFELQRDIVLHLDQFRNVRRDLYPFNYPSFDEVIGAGCANHERGTTSGLLDEHDPIHRRNYGACMCARRADLIEIGGADEHVDYLGHVCGPYEMTFRLVNAGRRERWHPTEFLYHTWHPGQAGVDNYLGPHDGRHMSTRALEALYTCRKHPLLENKAVARLRGGGGSDPAALRACLIDEDRVAAWMRHASQPRGRNPAVCAGRSEYKGFVIDEVPGGYRVRLCAHLSWEGKAGASGLWSAQVESFEGARLLVLRQTPWLLRVFAAILAGIAIVAQLSRYPLKLLPFPPREPPRMPERRMSYKG